MSREPKNNEEGFMYKLASFIVDKRNLIFLIVAIGLVFSVFSRNWVQVENQLSAYLPKDSETAVMILQCSGMHSIRWLWGIMTRCLNRIRNLSRKR